MLCGAIVKITSLIYFLVAVRMEVIRLGTPVNLSFTNGNSVDPLISFNPCMNTTGIVWSEDVSGNYEIFYLAVT